METCPTPRLLLALLACAVSTVARSAGLDLSLPPQAPVEAPAAAESPGDSEATRLPPVIVTAPHDAFTDADARLQKLKDSLGCLGCDGKQRDPRPRVVQIGEAIGQTMFGLFSAYRPPHLDEPNDRALAGAQSGISTTDNPGGGTVRPNRP